MPLSLYWICSEGGQKLRLHHTLLREQCPGTGCGQKPPMASLWSSHRLFPASRPSTSHLQISAMASAKILCFSISQLLLPFILVSYGCLAKALPCVIGAHHHSPCPPSCAALLLLRCTVAETLSTLPKPSQVNEHYLTCCPQPPAGTECCTLLTEPAPELSDIHCRGAAHQLNPGVIASC